MAYFANPYRIVAIASQVMKHRFRLFAFLPSR